MKKTEQPERNGDENNPHASIATLSAAAVLRLMIGERARRNRLSFFQRDPNRFVFELAFVGFVNRGDNNDHQGKKHRGDRDVKPWRELIRQDRVGTEKGGEEEMIH